MLGFWQHCLINLGSYRMSEFMLDISVVCPLWIVVSDLAFSKDHIYYFELCSFFFWVIYHILCFCEEMNDEYGNPIWKNRVESWKDKKNKKKKSSPKAETEPAQVPPEQQMEEKP